MKSITSKIHLKLSFAAAIALIVLAISLLTLVTISSQSLIDDRVYEREMPAQLKQVRNALERELLVPVTISKSMAENEFLLSWLRRGESTGERSQVIEFLKQTKRKNDASVAFWVSGNSRNYYTEKGVIKQISRQDDKWYYDFINSGNDYELSFDYNDVTGIPTVFVNYAVSLGSDRIAAAGVGMTLEQVRAVIDGISDSGSLVAFLVDSEGMIQVHPDKKISGRLGQYLQSDEQAKRLLDRDNLQFGEVNVSGLEMIVGATPMRIGDWYVVVMADKEEMYASLYSMVSFISIAGYALVALFVSLVYFGALRFVVPIRKVSQELQDFANRGGDLTREIPVRSNDELGLLVNSFNEFVRSLRSIISEVGDASVRLGESVLAVNDAVSNTTAQVAQQQEKTDMVATAMHEMGATVEEIARNANDAANQAASAKQDTADGEGAVTASADKINKLSSEITSAETVVSTLAEEVQGISSVLAVIRGVSEQTNLLALNAAIEAARAGEQGRGFAVVADEVRTLAQRTQESTEEINSMIDRLQRGASEAVSAMQAGSEMAVSGVETVESLRGVLSSIRTSVETVSDMNFQIASATEEQSLVTEDINGNVLIIADTGRQSVEQVAKTESESVVMSEQAEKLRQLVSQFKY